MSAHPITQQGVHQSEGHDQVHKRHRSILSAGVSAMFGKGVTILVNAAIVPITVRYLGAESYGLWITISSTVTMFVAMDIGISTTLTNLISEAYARRDKEAAAQYFATAFWSICAIAAILGGIGLVGWPYLHWQAIFHVQDAALGRETSLAMAAAFFLFLVSLPASLVTKVLAGYQELYAANLFGTAGNVLALLVVIGVVHFHGHLPLLVACYAGSNVMANVACLAWLCLIRKPWMKPWPSRIRRAFVRRILHSGVQFFAIQIAGVVVFSSDNLIISHFLSPAQVTPYSVTWRLVNYIVILQTFVFPALWPAFSEAWASGQMTWIRRTYNRVRWVTFAFLAAGCTLTVCFGRQFIKLWAGPAAMPSIPLLWLMCVWIVLYAITTNQSCLMGATGRVGKQAIASLLAAVVNVALSVLWVSRFGSTGVLLATVISYLFFIVAVQSWEVHRILRGDFVGQVVQPVRTPALGLDSPVDPAEIA